MTESSAAVAVSNRRVLILLFVLALAFRIIAVILYPEGTWTDGLQYDRIARNLLAGNGFSLAKLPPFEKTMFREPLYPLFLAAGYALPGHDLFGATALQVVVSALTCNVVYLLALEIGLRPKVALLSGLFATFHPGLALYSGRVMSETLSAFLLVVALWLFARAWRRESMRSFAGAGIGTGLAALVKGVLLPLPVCLAAAYLWFRRSGARPFKLAAVFVLVAFSTVAPWSVRNKIELGTFGISVRAGQVIWARAHMMTRDLYESVTPDMRARWRELRVQGLSEPQADSRMAQEGLAMIRSSPGLYLCGNAEEVYRLWVCSPNSRTLGADAGSCTSLKGCMTRGLRALAAPAFLLQVAFLIAGAFRLLRMGGPAWIPVVAVAFLTVAHSFLAYGSCRYALPVVPAALVLWAESASAAWSHVRRWSARFRLSHASR